MGEKNCELPLKNGAMGAKRPDSLPLHTTTAAAASKLWQKPPISPSLRRARLAGEACGSGPTAPNGQPSPSTHTGGAKAKVTTCLQVIPSPVTPGGGGSGGGSHHRSFTSVNLTLRPPSNEPQPPIDITSANASLTYSTSSFDVQNGLESRLQITVSPTGGSVASYRRRRPRPLSDHIEITGDAEETTGAVVHRSLPDLSARTNAAATTLPPPSTAAAVAIAENLGPPARSVTIRRQQACLDRLKSELGAKQRKLAAVQLDVAQLSRADPDAHADVVNAELEKQLLGEIRHLRGQCDRLNIEVDQRDEFYRNIYLGQRHPPNFGRSASEARAAAAASGGAPDTAAAGGWSCPKCTFHNHPEMGKCEQCDMPYILHGTLASQLKALSAPLNLPKIA